MITFKLHNQEASPLHSLQLTFSATWWQKIFIFIFIFTSLMFSVIKPITMSSGPYFRLKPFHADMLVMR